MDVLMACHIFTSTCQSAQSLRWLLVRLMSLSHVAHFLYVGRLGRFVYSRKVYVFSSVCPQKHLHMIIHSWAHLFGCIVCSFVGELVPQYVLLSFIPFFITPCFFVYLFLRSLMTRWHQIQKPPSLPWYVIISDAGDRERQQSCKVGCRLWELLMKNAQESLGDEDEEFGSTVTVREVWVS